MKVLFEPIKTKHNKMRTQQIIGELKAPPEIGYSVFITAKSLDENIHNQGGTRNINTSQVVQIKDTQSGWEILTASGSIYSISRLDTLN
jgi:hypothetical protein